MKRVRLVKERTQLHSADFGDRSAGVNDAGGLDDRQPQHMPVDVIQDVLGRTDGRTHGVLTARHVNDLVDVRMLIDPLERPVEFTVVRAFVDENLYTWCMLGHGYPDPFHQNTADVLPQTSSTD